MSSHLRRKPELQADADLHNAGNDRSFWRTVGPEAQWAAERLCDGSQARKAGERSHVGRGHSGNGAQTRGTFQARPGLCAWRYADWPALLGYSEASTFTFRWRESTTQSGKVGQQDSILRTLVVLLLQAFENWPINSGYDKKTNTLK